MDNKNDRQNFLDYINRPVSKESLAILYSTNNILFEKCELYSDYVQSLLLLVFDTYLGDDITSIEQQIKHFKWCWEKNIENFKMEGINLYSSKLYDYFLEFLLEVYYSSIEKGDNNELDKNLLRLWKNIFNFNGIKAQSDIDTLVEIYVIFEKSLKNS